MKLELIRKEFTAESTIGDLFIDGAFFCYVLEDAVRSKKIKGITAIPAGTYRGVVDYSPRFQKLMPRLLDVPGFEGVRIHSGNTAKDTEGCLIVGFKKEPNKVTKSRVAFAALMLKLKQSDFEITIRNADAAPAPTPAQPHHSLITG